MNIPAWRRYASRPLTLRLTPMTLVTFTGTVALLSGAVGVVGYAVGAKTAHPQPKVVVTVPVKSTEDSEQQLKAMNERMAELQARLLQLDALGQHVAESAKLNNKEFDFGKGPTGGPLLDDLSLLADRPNIELRLQELTQQVDHKEAQLQALDRLLAGKKQQENHYLANLPVRYGSITSTYGYRTDPFTGHAAFHSGIDFAGPEGTDIYAVAAGVVSYAGEKTGYGNAVEITHGNGYVTRYGHASRIWVKAGDRIAKDQLIAAIGSTGRSTGPHLHYEVLLNGHQIDPASYIHVAMNNK